jgi:L-malate glycosyltransferase
MRKLKVALVAPTLQILGGQSVQADRLLRQWKGDAEVEAWLVPVNPPLPRAVRFAASVKYLRTVINELIYIPSLVRQVARADVVHVFSASYFSFLLAPLPAILAARALKRPIVLNYRSGEAPDHLARSAVARWALRTVDRNVVPSRFLVEVFQPFGIEAGIIPNVVDFDRFRFRDRPRLQPRILSTRNFDGLYNVACTVRAFGLVSVAFPRRR